MFNGLDLTYDGRSASEFGLQIVNFSNGKKDESFTPSYEILEEKARSRDVPHFFGVEAKEPLTLTITLGSESELDRYDKNRIAQWISKQEYCQLVIDQEDLEDVTYFAICESSKQVHVGNVAYAIELKMRCNAPYPYKYFSDHYTLTAGDNPLTLMLYLETGLDKYIYPELEVYNGEGTDVFRIIIENDYTMEVSSLTGGEWFVIDSDLGTLSGNITHDNFNGNWLRLIPGDNRLVIGGTDGTQIWLTYFMPILN